MTDQELATLGGQIGAQLALALGGCPIVVPGDATLPTDKDATFLLTKGSAAAIVLTATPGAALIGRRITIIAGSNQSHVVTCTAAIGNGTAAKSTWTSAAFIGSSLTLRCVSATMWATEANILGAFA